MVITSTLMPPAASAASAISQISRAPPRKSIRKVTASRITVAPRSGSIRKKNSSGARKSSGLMKPMNVVCNCACRFTM